VAPTACLVPERPVPSTRAERRCRGEGRQVAGQRFKSHSLVQGGEFGTDDSSGARFPQPVSAAINNSVLIESTTAVWPQAPAISDQIRASAHTPMMATIAQPMRLANRLLTCRPMIARLLPTSMIIAIRGGASTPLTAAA